MAEPSTKDRILDTFVYGPLGFALYARDAAPSVLRIFVARGRSEFDRHKDQVTDQVNDGVETAMTVGQQAMASAPEVRKRVENAAGQAIDLVEGVVTNLRESASQTVTNGGSSTTEPAPAPKQVSKFEAVRPSPPSTESAPSKPAPATPSSTPRTPPTTASAPAPSPAPPAAPSPAPRTTPPTPSAAQPERPAATSGAANPLPIPDYDELAASQVVERLEGLDLTELEAVADYERARRGRRTILGKIEQLTG